MVDCRPCSGARTGFEPEIRKGELLSLNNEFQV